MFCSAPIYNVDVETFGGKWRQKLTSWHKKHPDIMHESRLTPPCKTTFPCTSQWCWNEPRHEKTNKVSVRPAKTLISLGIRPVWWESSLSAWRNLWSLATHWAHNEDSDQTGQMPRLIWVFAGRTATLLVLSCRGSNSVGYARKICQYSMVTWRWNLRLRNVKVMDQT